jgi:cytoskeletal protein CcmA (bactofilin family)
MGLFDKKQDEKKPVPPPPAPAGKKEATYFGKNLKIKGNVSGNGDIIILGELEGEFNLKGALQIAEPANVTGEVKANNITVKGTIEGSITAVDKIHLDPTAKIKGHIKSPKISVMDGALFDGEITMSSQSVKPSYSPISESSSPPKPSEDIEKK